MRRHYICGQRLSSVVTAFFILLTVLIFTTRNAKYQVSYILGLSGPVPPLNNPVTQRDPDPKLQHDSYMVQGENTINYHVSSVLSLFGQVKGSVPQRSNPVIHQDRVIKPQMSSDIPQAEPQMQQPTITDLSQKDPEISRDPDIRQETPPGCSRNSSHLFNPYTLSGVSVDAFIPSLANATEQECLPAKFSTSFSFPHTALASFPGSGNTWTRRMIQRLTGTCTYHCVTYPEN